MTEENTSPMFEDPQDMVESVYISSYRTSAMITQYKEAREEFVMDTSEFLLDTVPNVNETEAEMMAEDLLDEVFGNLLSHIEEDGIGLWMTLGGEDKQAMDFPVYTRSPIGGFNSMNPGLNQVDKTEPDEVFFEAIRRIVENNEDQDEGVSWGGIPEDIWDELTDTEQEIVYRVRNAVIEMTEMSHEIALLIEYAKSVTLEE